MKKENELLHNQFNLKHRFAAHILMFDVEPFLLRAIDNCAPYVEKIYVAYSDKPWVYNAQARELITNPTRLDLLEQSPWRNKIEVIQGEWKRKEDQRNVCLEQARKDGMDFLIIHDADEFYTEKDYIFNIRNIDENAEYEIYRTPWCSFWKNTSWIISNHGSTIVGYPEFAINCSKNVRFIRARTTSAQNELTLSGLCYHLSFVRSDQDALRKLSTWGHSHQVDIQKWYREKWLHWYPAKKNLHPVFPSAWEQAVPFTGNLPTSLTGLKYGSFSVHLPSLKERMCDVVKNSVCYYRSSEMKAFAKKKLDQVGLLVLVKWLWEYAKKFKIFIYKLSGKLYRLYTIFMWKRIYTSKIATNPSIRLHLGCGSNHIEGMVNCEYRATTAADVVMDCSDLSHFLTHSIDLIFSHAFFEHLYSNQRLHFLCECQRILKPNKRIIFLGLPDLRIIAKNYLDGVEFMPGRLFDASVMYRYTHGDPEIAPEWWTEQLHKSLFDRDVVKDLLCCSGFEHFALFNYRYIGEDIPLNLGVIAWHGNDKELDLRQELTPFLDKIRDITDCIETLTLYDCESISAQK